MTVEQQIKNKLQNCFNISELILIDDSHKHKNHKKDTSGGHFKLLIVSNDFIMEIEDVLKNYQIKITKYLSKNYVNNFFNSDEMDLTIKSNKILNGCNENEVLVVSKKPKNQGFFEKFFQLFS